MAISALDSFSVKDTLKAFDNFKNKQKNVPSKVFFTYTSIIFWKFIQYTIYWEKTQTLKKFLWTK